MIYHRHLIGQTIFSDSVRRFPWQVGKTRNEMGYCIYKFYQRRLFLYNYIDTVSSDLIALSYMYNVFIMTRLIFQIYDYIDRA